MTNYRQKTYGTVLKGKLTNERLATTQGAVTIKHIDVDLYNRTGEIKELEGNEMPGPNPNKPNREQLQKDMETMTLDEIAVKYNGKPSSISYWIKNYGLQRDQSELRRTQYKIMADALNQVKKTEGVKEMEIRIPQTTASNIIISSTLLDQDSNESDMAKSEETRVAEGVNNMSIGISSSEDILTSQSANIEDKAIFTDELRNKIQDELMDTSESMYLEFEKVLIPILGLLEKKNKDYGRSYDKLREEFGEVSFLIRLSDKYNRLKTLTYHPASVEDESIIDTIYDVIGYCTLELAYRKNIGGMLIYPKGV